MNPERGRKPEVVDAVQCPAYGISEREPRKGTETTASRNPRTSAPPAISEREPRKGTETILVSILITHHLNIFQNVNPERGRKLDAVSLTAPQPFSNISEREPRKGTETKYDQSTNDAGFNKFQNVNPERGRKHGEEYGLADGEPMIHFRT